MSDCHLLTLIVVWAVSSFIGMSIAKVICAIWQGIDDWFFERSRRQQ